MPISFHVDPSATFLHSTASGVVSVEGILRHLKAKGEANALTRAELFDARNVTLDLSAQDLRQIADEVRQMMGGKKSGAVAVVTNSGFIQGLARAYASMVTLQYEGFEVFTTMRDARKWILQFEKQTNRAAPISLSP